MILCILVETMLMKDVRCFCEDVPKATVMLPIDFLSWQCKTSALLPSQCHQPRLRALGRAGECAHSGRRWL